MNTGSLERHERILRAWHLAILRFAVTRDDLDRLNVLAIAQEMDRSAETKRESEFRFFRKASAELCLAIPGQNEPALATLRSYLAQISEPRLKQAFAAAVGMPVSDATPAKRRPKQDQNLFRGLPVRKHSGLARRRA